MRDPNRLAAAIADADSRAAALGMLRQKHDPEFRRRYGRYLRGEIGPAELMQGETHAQWYARWCVP